MDCCRNVSVPSEYQQEPVLSPPCSKLGSLDDLFPAQNTEVDVSLEWLSIFVEDCLSSTGNRLPVAASNTTSSVETPILPIFETYWLADSELILPKKEEHKNTDNNNKVKEIEVAETRVEGIEKTIVDVVMVEEEGSNGNMEGSSGRQ